jgi:hypothetical protein
VNSKYFPSFPVAFSLAGVDDGTDLENNKVPLPPALEAYLEELGAEIKQKQPEVILIDDSPQCQGCPPSLNLSHMLASIGFTGDMILTSYNTAVSVENVKIFTKK